MKPMFYAIAAAAALALGAPSFAAGPVVAGHGAKAAKTKAVPDGQSLLWDQSANDAGIAILSQNFEAAYDTYDSQAADDFVVPAGQSWKVKSLDVLGQYFNGSGPAATQHVTFYANQGGKPGEVIADFPGLTGKDNAGSFSIKLPQAVKLKAGTYWVSVLADLDYSVGGEWGWESSTDVTGKPAMWVNANDGFGTGCTTYTKETTCIPDGQGDHMFKLYGKAKGGE